jgi:hypothetical protein
LCGKGIPNLDDRFDEGDLDMGEKDKGKKEQKKKPLLSLKEKRKQKAEKKGK